MTTAQRVTDTRPLPDIFDTGPSFGNHQVSGHLKYRVLPDILAEYPKYLEIPENK